MGGIVILWYWRRRLYIRHAFSLWIIHLTETIPRQDYCLTGYMTDVQSWVNQSGCLVDEIAEEPYSLDLSAMHNTVALLQSHLQNQVDPLRYLSLARCGFLAVPEVFEMMNGRNNSLAHTLEYLTLTGNNFVEVSISGVMYNVTLDAIDVVEQTPQQISMFTKSDENNGSMKWYNGFRGVVFHKLKELDLRMCGIWMLESNQFANMSALEALYLGENAIHTIQYSAFSGLTNLLHLDLSRNYPVDDRGLPQEMTIGSVFIFVDLLKLQSLDLSHSKIRTRNVSALRRLPKSLERLSLCHVGPIRLEDNYFLFTSIKYLDISGNLDMLSSFSILRGLESTLKVLYATDIGLKDSDIFYNFTKLEVLRLSNNALTTFRAKTAKSLTSLQALDLSRNRISSWFDPVYSYIPRLKLLLLSMNNINFISSAMLEDFSAVTYLAFSQNSMVCNCFLKEFIELAARNEYDYESPPVIFEDDEESERFEYHTAYADINYTLLTRKNISYLCPNNSCDSIPLVEGGVLLLDYNADLYNCFELERSESIPLTKVSSCVRSDFVETSLEDGRRKLNALLVLPGLLLLSFLAFVFRKKIRYFYLTLRNSALISMVNPTKVINDDTIFIYDVFVSYCNDDRPWVLEHLLPNLEKNNSVSLCLHERDFQVGLTILENIVSCMDRSKFIMLIISQQFMLSQWCQFEMHLAQHRLLETRREDLILVLLEEIPRPLRPNTLHYLMITKTYIVWPKKKSEHKEFWKRLKKSILSQKQRQREFLA